MTEKHLLLDDVDLLTFYGTKNAHLQLLKALYPKLRLVARGDLLKVMGDEEEIAAFAETIDRLRNHCLHYNALDEPTVIAIAKGGQAPAAEHPDEAICYSVGGKAIIPRSEHQRQLAEEFRTKDLVFVTGPAGSGKTYLSIALAVRALKSKEIRKIILSRPAVEAGEKLGFLPGDMKDKIDPYLQPLYDALQDMLPAKKLGEYLETGVIQIAPLAFMRGRTLNDAVVILDEAQNTTGPQIKMFLTRMGQNTKMIVTGDLTQIDLPHSVRSGLKDAIALLANVEGIGFVRTDQQDIVRHRLVTRIVNAYEARDKERQDHRNDQQPTITHADERTNLH